MNAMIRLFLKNRSGATVVEYGLIIAVLSLTIVGGVGKATSALQFLFSDNESKLQQAFEANDKP